MDNSESPDCPFTSILKQPLNSGHPATLYNEQLLQSQLYASILKDPDLADTRRPFQQDCPPCITAVVNNLTLD